MTVYLWYYLISYAVLSGFAVHVHKKVTDKERQGTVLFPKTLVCFEILKYDIMGV